MLNRLSKVVLVAALTISLGLPTVLLQSVAWVSMIVSFSQSAPLREAVAKTFDGAHPCKICKLVNQAKKSEKKSSHQNVAKKFDLISISAARFFLGTVPGPEYPSCDLRGMLRSYPPLCPPPDLA
jgi:hypothetical protein